MWYMYVCVDLLYSILTNILLAMQYELTSKRLAGIVSFVGLLYLRTSTKKSRTPAVPSLWSNPSRKDAPWKFPKRWKKATPFSPRVTSVVALVLLVNAYFITGRFALFWEDSLYALAGIGFPLTIAMHRSLCVLMGHLTWVVSGSAILKIVLSPQPFFGGGRQKIASDDDEEDDDVDSVQMKKKKTPIQKWRWYSSKWDTYWLWWTIGGYFVSSWLFNCADFLNQVILPPFIFEEAAEGVVSQLINPENNDLLASLVGYIAPCISAPWWEEVLYRGFLLPALCLFMNFWSSVFLSGIIFSAHHLSVTGAIPLAILGWVWAVIYAKSGNLLVTIMIHAMWNSRVFLGSWLGL
jgi:membrane protease YdiL (CAAX protease family)